MSVIIVLLLVVGVARGLFAAWRWWQNRPQPEPDPERKPEGEPEEADAALPTFRVVSLGVAGTGKTVLLASIFNELKQTRPGRSYRVDAKAKDRRFLSRLWTQLIDTEGDWPRGTRRTEARLFDFDFVPSGRTKRPPMFRISYLDFSGETLEEGVEGSDDADIESLEAHIDEAHSLFGVIDGRLLMAYLNDEPEGIRYMDGSIMTMIGYLARGTAPIHFLVTKWDLVHGIGETSSHHESRLGIVRRALLDHRDIADLLRSDELDGRSVRLIPVSAVGDNFAELDQKGRTVKRHKARAEPYHLDLPFAAVAHDYFADLSTHLSSTDETRLRDDAPKRARLTRAKSVRSGLKALRATTKAALAVAMGFAGAGPTVLATEPLVDLLFDWVSRPELIDDDPESQGLSEAELERARLHSRRAATLDDFEKSIWNLESEHPSSILRPGR